ncbi:MAG: PA2169 family four-helix-bundle protein [Geminicoccaceae bacterium]
MAADKTVGTLNHLIAVCRDGEEFYGYAIEKVSKPQLQELLRATAGLHREIGEALRPHVSGAGASAAEGGTLSGKFRQLKGGLKATWASDTERVLVPELEQAEQAVVQAFEQALAEPMADAAKRLVAGKLEILRATHARFVEVARRAADA